MKAGSVRVDFDFEGEPQVQRRLRRLSEHALDARPAFAKMLRSVDRAVGGQYRSKGMRGGTPWKRLAEATLLARRKMGVYHKRILEVTGRMRASVTAKRGPGSIRRATPTEMLWATTVGYAKYHQSRKPRRKKADGSDFLPRRPILALTPLDRERMVKVLQLWVVRGRLA